jgi:hypothetical protein
VILTSLRSNDGVPGTGFGSSTLERVVKLLHSLDHTMWSGKVEAILE